MSDKPNNLIQGYLDGMLTDQQQQQLTQWLQADPANAKTLAREVYIHTRLRHALKTHQLQERAHPDYVNPSGLNHLIRVTKELPHKLHTHPIDKHHGTPEWQSPRRNPMLVWGGWALAAAAMLVMAILIAFPSKHGSGSSELTQNPKSDTFTPVAVKPTDLKTDTLATVVESFDALWKNSDQHIVKGKVLKPGQYDLQSGILQLALHNGTNVVIEAPCQFKLNSLRHLSMNSGKLVARITPEATGFTVQTPNATIVDKGTEFGVAVRNKMKTDSLVLDGEVQLSMEGNVKGTTMDQVLQKNQACRAEDKDNVKQITPIKARPDEFITEATLSRWIAARRTPYGYWLGFMRKFRIHKDLLVYFPFNGPIPPKDRKIENFSQPSGEDFRNFGKAKVTGGDWYAGRFHHTLAWKPKAAGDGISLQIPGRYKKLTLAMWVWLDGPGPSSQGLCMTDQWEQQGAFHWQIANSNQIVLGVSGTSNYSTPSGLLNRNKDFQRWMHLAITYDLERHQLRFYKDGNEMTVLPIREDIPLQPSKLHLGCWSQEGSSRNLNGRIGGFMMFSRALTAEEIQKIQAAGNPAEQL